MDFSTNVSRRTALRGFGLSLGLPWLSSLEAPRASAFSATPGTAPRRLAFIFSPNGVNLPEWTPQKAGFAYDLPPILRPLESLRDRVSVLSGLTHDKGRANGDGPGDHARAASVFLTGAQPRKTDGSNIRVGVSVDQVMARQVGQLTRFPSLELGCEQGRGAGNCDSGYSCAYSSNISWNSETTPVGKEIDPKLAFERLFSDGRPGEVADSRGQREAFRQSVLDYVSEDAKRLQKKLGRDDQKKLDEYLNSVREIEQRIARSVTSEDDPGQAVDLGYPAPAGVPKDYGEHVRLMCDMMVLAFQTDSTRVATMMFANAGSNRSYRNLGIADGHHQLSHHGGDARKLEKISRINQYHIAQLAYFLRRLGSIPEGDGTLLDHSLVLYGSGLSDGNRHNNEDLPILLCGGGGGDVTPGRHIRFEQETPMCNLFLSMLDVAGASVDFMGDSTGRLSGLKV